MPRYKKFDCPNLRDKAEYLVCEKHDYVFKEGYHCPMCKNAVRDIYSEWEPSDEQFDERPDNVALGLLDAEYQHPAEGIYKFGICPLHQMPYIEGISECPQCRCWAL